VLSDQSQLTPSSATASGDCTREVKVSVLTPVYNEQANLERILERFLNQEDPGGAIEFIFIDGRSDDTTRAILHRVASEDPRIRLLDNPRRITSAALNVALAAARGQFVARMDAHALYPPDYLSRGVRRLAVGDVSAVSGPQIAVGHDPWSNRVAAALGTRLGVGGSNFRHVIDREIETDSGFTGLWRRDLLIAFDGWDEEAYPNEDSELAARLREAGHRLVLVPEMAAQYTPRDSLRSLALQYWRYGRARARTARRHPISLRRSHLLPPALVIATLAAVGAPRRARPAARLLLASYVLALLATAIRSPAPRSDSSYLPIVLPVMHYSWGCGFLVGCILGGPAVKFSEDV
jgi:succinoglycan biosynthesis protein ExoA